MPAVDIAPMMNHPAWGSKLTPEKRRQALDLWQAPDTSDSDRSEMLKVMDQWLSAPAAQAPAPTQQAPAASTVPAEETPTPERRFLDLPSVQALPLEERTQLFQDFYGRSAERKEEFLRSKEPSPSQTPAVPAVAPGASPSASPQRLSMGDPREAASATEARATIAGMRARQTPAMERFLALPSIAQLTPAEREQVQQEFQGLTPDQQEEVIRREVPRDLHQAMEQPAPSAQTPRAAPIPAPAPGPASATRIEPLSSRSTEVLEAEINRPAPLPVPPEVAIAAIPGMAGYAIGAKLAPLLGPIGRAVPPLLEAAGGYLGHRANVKLGYEQEGPLGDVMSVLPLVTRSLGSATAGWLERTMKEVPAAAGNQMLDLLGKLFSRGGVPATLTYAISHDPQLAAWVGGSTAVARQLLEFGLRHPDGKKLVETVLKAGRAIGAEELGMLMNIGRTGHTATPHSASAREGKAPVALAPLMDHPAWKGKLKTDQQRRQALDLWQDAATSDSDRAEMLKVMDQWQAAP